ncbi:MAG: hypothetical protein ACREQ5_05880 [Candidatus Dormibacteria bacterium]
MALTDTSADRIVTSHASPSSAAVTETPRDRQVLGGSCVPLPEIGADPAAGPSPELAGALALQRAHRGEMARLGDHYIDRRCLPLLYLTRAFNELVDAGLLALADPDPHGLQQVTLTDAGRTRYAQLRGTPPRPEFPVPDPQFPNKTPAGRRPSTPMPYSAPGGQPVPHRPAEASSASVEHQPQRARLPVRSPGAHLHPQLRRPTLAGRCGEGGASR